MSTLLLILEGTWPVNPPDYATQHSMLFQLTISTPPPSHACAPNDRALGGHGAFLRQLEN
jgi:hypothetical protein